MYVEGKWKWKKGGWMKCWLGLEKQAETRRMHWVVIDDKTFLTLINTINIVQEKVAKTHFEWDFVNNGFLASHVLIDCGPGWFTGWIGDKNPKFGKKRGLLVNQGSPFIKLIAQSHKMNKLLS